MIQWFIIIIWEKYGISLRQERVDKETDFSQSLVQIQFFFQGTWIALFSTSNDYARLK